MTMGKKIPELCAFSGDCCGCAACEAMCPCNAITMVENEDGFKYPKIDEDKCIRCGACLSVCAFKKNQEKKKESDSLIYAAKTSPEIMKKSSSGGMFTILSDYIINKGGAIISAIYNADNKNVEFRLYGDVENRNLARGSKYIQASMLDIFNRGEEWVKLNPGKKLMFVGTGCQAAGFNEFAKKKNIRENVYIVDLICHGAPSPGLWRKYGEFIEKKNKGHLREIFFKDKRNGWMNPSVYGLVEGKEISIKGYSDWFYEQYSIRESCFLCPYTKIERDTDITIGDFWGVKERYPEFYDYNGVSLVIIHSDFGKKIFDKIKPNLKWIEVEREKCLQPRLVEPAKKPKRYDKFWVDIKVRGIEYCEKRYKQKKQPNFLQKVIAKLKKIV